MIRLGPGLRVPLSGMPCDAHLHIIDRRFPAADPSVKLPANMTLSDYRLLQHETGTVRAVIVQPKHYGTDNRCTLDAIAQLNGHGRGIAVAHPDISDAQLRQLDAGGIRGLRFSLWNPADATTSIEMIEPLSRRIQGLGWHVQLHMSGCQIARHAALIERLACPIVFDHMGRLPPHLGIAHPAYAVIGHLVNQDRAWVKLSGAYLNTDSGPPAYADACAVARAFARDMPQRLLWGSDWPHITEACKPAAADLVGLLLGGMPAEMIERVLVDNPARLYGF
ncbi:Predicted metal-dependent hydrolase, TIM-barrel fold [Pollutimonas bauzanensis]|uniref:Predicted metal-dependent hydrolase, TIM-barrel fold n=2 Tax=Pollutimonas bauzanensis TaxID=658167 RepID=A0A1M5YYM8_9BURK|nr:Predicted metal-dependent hydrolase, TIM-barrel fold [Pollutimonas bauzanensis]